MVRFESDLKAIDDDYTDKHEAKDQMEEFLAMQGLNKENRISIILDYIVAKTMDEAQDAEVPTQSLYEIYCELVDKAGTMRKQMIVPFKDDDSKMNLLIEQQTDELKNLEFALSLGELLTELKDQ